MSDKELLELAAKAAGIPGIYDESCNGIVYRGGIFGEGWWRPLEIDGDAFRLAVKLLMVIQPLNAYSIVEVYPAGKAHFAVNCSTKGDESSGWRRAIVGCAAEIGKAMP